MRDETILAMFIAFCVVILECVALYHGHNGILLSSVFVLLGGLGGLMFSSPIHQKGK